MNRINEFDLEPGVYRHYKGGMYVVTDVVTHMDNAESGKMEALPDPLVVYHDLTPVDRHVNGKPTKSAHQVYAKPLSQFKGMASHNELPVKRFTKE